MANHQSAKKRIRKSEVRRVKNRYQAVTTRNLVKKIRLSSSKTEAEGLLSETFSKLDKLAKTNIIHHKKAGNLKSKLTKFVAKLS